MTAWEVLAQAGELRADLAAVAGALRRDEDQAANVLLDGGARADEVAAALGLSRSQMFRRLDRNPGGRGRRPRAATSCVSVGSTEPGWASGV
jgi:predicted DNA-binding transcriptional regulator AlpA